MIEVIMLNNAELSVIMLSDIMVIVVAPKNVKYLINSGACITKLNTAVIYGFP